MSTPFLGEIRLFSMNFPPKGWALCNGQILPINQNQALFAILGTTYGGDGRTTFALPDLRGRVAIHTGNGHVIGERAGEENHRITFSELPSHSHNIKATKNVANSYYPAGKVWATTAVSSYYPSSDVDMHPLAVSSTGGSQSHPNMQPYSVLNYCISLSGIFPSQY